MSEPALRYYACGETQHDLAQVFRGHVREQRVFPAGVFLFQHQSGARVLFDTGYAPSMRGTGLKGALYQRILPPDLTAEDTIEAQLQWDGIDPASIGSVVLSHLHPDHIGGVRYFPGAQFVVSAGLRQTLQQPRLRDGVFPQLFPDWFNDADMLVLGDKELHAVTGDGLPGYDMFGDGSYVVTELPGHARGHLGAFVLGKALLAGDAAWGTDMLCATDTMRRLPQLVQYDFAAYRDTAASVAQLQANGMAIYLSHDTYEQRVLIP